MCLAGEKGARHVISKGALWADMTGSSLWAGGGTVHHSEQGLFDTVDVGAPSARAKGLTPS